MFQSYVAQKTGDVHINVVLRRVLATIVAAGKQ
jgi:hypothetical protein